MSTAIEIVNPDTGERVSFPRSPPRDTNWSPRVGGSGQQPVGPTASGPQSSYADMMSSHGIAQPASMAFGGGSFVGGFGGPRMSTPPPYMRSPVKRTHTPSVNPYYDTDYTIDPDAPRLPLAEILPQAVNIPASLAPHPSSAGILSKYRRSLADKYKLKLPEDASRIILFEDSSQAWVSFEDALCRHFNRDSGGPM